MPHLLTQPFTLSLYFSGAAMRQLESILEVQHRMARRTALLCQHALEELAAAESSAAALSIQCNVALGTFLDIAKLCGEMSLAVAPPLPEPVIEALAETSPPGATPQQVSGWSSSGAIQAATAAQEAISRAAADDEAPATERPQAATEPKQRPGKKTQRRRASPAARKAPGRR